MKKFLFSLVLAIVLFSIGFNTFFFLKQRIERRPFNQGWYTYDSGKLAWGENVFSSLSESISPNDTVFISAFEWPRLVTPRRPPHHGLDLKLAHLLDEKKTKVVVYIDPLGFDFQNNRELIKEGAKIEVILDPNKSILTYNIPFVPNIVAIDDLSSKIEVKIYDAGDFFFHVKSALFTLDDETQVFMWGSANWTRSELVTATFNDLDVLIVPTKEIQEEFLKEFDTAWEVAKDRSEFKIDHPKTKLILTKLFQTIGAAPFEPYS
jgi:hypothetical protein